MRSICGILAVVATLGLATTAVAAGPCYGDSGMWANHNAYGGYSAPACGAPWYGLVPGCCEFPPSCCRHVWDGYCQELRGMDAVRAFFPNRCGRGCGQGAGLHCSQPACGPADAGCCPIDDLPGDAPETETIEDLLEIPPAPPRAG
jgi:hypothetical protein